MNIVKSDPRVVHFSTLIYRLLLITYPKDFQQEYSSSMSQVFRDCCLRAFHTRGLPGMLSLWSLTLTDYIESAFEEFTRKVTHLNLSRFIRLSGWALILGTAMFLTGVLVGRLMSWHGSAFDPFNLYSRPIDQFVEVLSYILIPSAVLLLTIGVMGIYLLFGNKAGLLGKMGLQAGMVGGGLALATCLGGGKGGLTQFLLYNQVGGNLLWDLGMLGMFLLFGGIFTFGIGAIRHQLRSLWKFIPLIAGALIPLRILLGYLQEATTEGFYRWSLDMQIANTPILIITSLGLMALGYLIVNDAPKEEHIVIGKTDAPNTV